MRLLEHAPLSRQERGVDSFHCRKGLGYILGGRSRFRDARISKCLKEYILGGRGGFRECPTVAYGCLRGVYSGRKRYSGSATLYKRE